MKKKELISLRTKKIEELKKLVKEKKLAYTQTLARAKSEEEKNLKKGKNLKKETAQILTFIREKEISQKEEKKL